jgi:hypothetical protein
MEWTNLVLIRKDVSTNLTLKISTQTSCHYTIKNRIRRCSTNYYEKDIGLFVQEIALRWISMKSCILIYFEVLNNV